MTIFDRKSFEVNTLPKDRGHKRLTGYGCPRITWHMDRVKIQFQRGQTRIVGSTGVPAVVRAATTDGVLAQCDIVELRLDLLHSAGVLIDPDMWEHLVGVPLLITARRSDEGGAGKYPVEARHEVLKVCLKEAASVDVEVASLSEMEEIIGEIKYREIPWIASFHDFEKLPETQVLERAAEQAKHAGAAVFKLAAYLHSPADMARLAEFQLANHGIPVATMGMGPLATVSRMLCHQCGSVLNYGYLGDRSTAPGQLSAAELKSKLAGLPSMLAHRF